MKKLIAILLCLALLVLPGCGEKEDVYILLTPWMADLELAPNVILEPEEPPYNLGGWTFGDNVWWDLTLPREDTYTLRFWYSMPGDYQPCTGWVALLSMEHDVIHREPLFVPTSTDGGWETYDYLDVAFDLPAGEFSLSVDSFEIPEGQDYFMNLRAVEIFTGELAPVEPLVVEDHPHKTAPELGTEAEDSGIWWTCIEGFPDSGIGLSAALYMNTETRECVLYNMYGQQFGTFPYIEDGEFLTVDLGEDVGPCTYRVTEEYLVYTDRDTIEFELTGKPDFWDPPQFEGTWYRCGDPESPSYYEMEDGHYRRIFVAGGEPMVEYEGFCIYDEVEHYTNDLVHRDVPHLFMEGLEDLDFYPVMGGMAICVEEDLRYQVYAREDSSDPEKVWAWMALEDLMNGGAFGTASDGTELLLRFEGYGFYFTMFAPDGERLDGAPYGSWTLGEEDTMEMESADGVLLELPIPQDGDTIVYPFRGEDVVLNVSTP